MQGRYFVGVAVFPILLSLAWFSPVLAARPRVAVLEFSNTHRDPALANAQAAQALTRAVIYFLGSTHRFEVVANPLLEKKLSRESVQSDPAGALAAVQGLGLDYLLTGLLEGDAVTTEADLSFILLTGPKAGTIAVDLRAVGYTIPSVGYLAYGLAEKAKQAFPFQGKVLLPLENGQFLIDQGREDGLQVGEALVVGEMVNEVRDENGKIIYRGDYRQLGRARVTGVDDQTAKCELINAAGPVRKNMIVASAPPAEAEPGSGAKLRVAVGEPRVMSSATPAFAGPMVADLLIGQLANACSNLEVLERAQLGALQDEMRLSQRPDFDWSRTVKAGDLRGASILVIPMISRRDQGYELSARVDDVATSRVLVTTPVAGAELVNPISQLAQEIGRLLRPLVPEETGPGLPRATLRCDYDNGVLPATQYECLRRYDLGLVRWALENTGNEPQMVRVTTDIPGYAVAPWTTEIELKPHQRLDSMGQRPVLDWPKVRSLPEEANPVQIKCTLELLQGQSARKLLDRSYKVSLLRPGIWMARLNSLDLLPSVAVLAQNSDLLRGVRDEAAALCSRNAPLPGYQLDPLGLGAAGDTPEARSKLVRDQVEAIYRAVAAHGIKYVDQSGIVFPPRDAQRILTPDEVLNGGGANCLDGTVLFAALLSPGLQPVMIITDDHAFVAWHTWSNAEAPYEVLETTLVGATDFAQALARARKEAQDIGILDLLDAKRGPLAFNPKGELIAPCEVSALPGIQAILDVRMARAYFQSAN